MQSNPKELIFIVDDRPSNLQLLSEFLKESGFKVLVARDGESALKKLEKISPDLILLDVMMPGIDGFETCRRIKASPATHDIPVIFMTVLSDTADKVKGFEAGGVDYITKPIQGEEVLARINVHLHLRSLTKQLQDAKQAAEAANRTKTEFLANMSHELRTPLNAILGIAQILQGSKTMTEEECDHIRIVYQSGSHLLTLLNDILDLSKIEAGKMELYPTDFTLPAFLQDVVEICRIWAQQKGIAFNYQPSPELPTAIHADEKRLRQILINLLGNAIKFTDQGGVTFNVERIENSAAKIRFQVEDTGIGISLEQLDNIFLPFEQVGNNQCKAEGTGLGLAISQKIIQMMGSTLKVTSYPGVGSIFWIDLDLPDAKESIPTVQSLPSSSSLLDQWDSQIAQQLPLRILIAEDNIVNQKVALHLLKRLGYHADIASNGKEVLSSLRHQSYDVVLMDVQMPEMDGLQASRVICQEWSETERPRIIAMTAGAMEGDRDKCLAAGMSDYISKPIRLEAVVKALRQCRVQNSQKSD
ncbi:MULTISPECIES: response regulator [unclassified Coleofasciculus]|uniref:response regulator n=1 Tax=unclassified Coleofasciculus TaxID=2692782 RepID=UPI0018807C0C|nr:MULTISPECIES: response regulator [unclassified Coleofasciculus]MBE9128723.1 response regulator [Coleofasciculus sp. LEGE 07081]MBE9151492.1 response regulator [Coleofasciculus sp. LEGE 07092]